ncbi:MAG: hypothetical protein WCB15_28505, partial [Desulfobacterales bacterium]
RPWGGDYDDPAGPVGTYPVIVWTRLGKASKARWTNAVDWRNKGHYHTLIIFFKGMGCHSGK